MLSNKMHGCIYFSYNIFCIFRTYIVSIRFIFHFHNIFVMTCYVNDSVINTLIHVGRIKMLHTHTYPFVCSQHGVTGLWNWTVSFDLQAQKYLYWLKCHMVTKFLSLLVEVMACHQFGASHCLNQWWHCQLEPWKQTSMKLYCKYK